MTTSSDNSTSPSERPTPARRLQDLPPRWARFCLAVGGFARNELGCDFAARRCLVACSGGPDSTALLIVAALLCRRAGGSVAAAHLDHRLRPESGADAAFVETLCRSLDVPLTSIAQDVAAEARAAGSGVEEAGRRVRYAFLERVRRTSGAELILLGHQLDDLAEDQLLRLLRGVGWPELGGMTAYDPERRLLRPFLLTPKTELEDFLRACGQDWRIDATNFTRETLRNRVRNGVLPALLAENPAYRTAAARLWRQARLDAAQFAEETSAARRRMTLRNGELLVPADLLRESPPPLRLRILKAALEDFGPGQALCDGLLRLESLWRERRFGASIRFPGDKEARLTAQGILLRVIDREKASG